MTATAVDHVKELKALGACHDGLEFAKGFDDWQKCWDSIDRGDWSLWVLGRLAGPPESDGRKLLVLVACKCARLALKHIPGDEKRPLAAIETAESWARGESVSIDRVRAAANAANAAYAAYAADAAANAAYAAYAADAEAYAAYAAYAAAHAAYAAAHAAARKQTLRECADIVREFFPSAPGFKEAA